MWCQSRVQLLFTSWLASKRYRKLKLSGCNVVHRVNIISRLFPRFSFYYCMKFRLYSFPIKSYFCLRTWKPCQYNPLLIICLLILPCLPRVFSVMLWVYIMSSLLICFHCYHISSLSICHLTLLHYSPTAVLCKVVCSYFLYYFVSIRSSLYMPRGDVKLLVLLLLLLLVYCYCYRSKRV